MKLKHKSLGVFKTINLSGWEGFVLQDFDNLIPGWFKTFVQVGNDLIWSQYLIGLLLTAGFSLQLVLNLFNSECYQRCLEH